MSEQSVLLPPVDSDPAYNALLEADAAARVYLQAMQAKGNSSAITNAEWNVADASGAILAYEQNCSGKWLRDLRFVIRHFPELHRIMLMELLGLDVLRDGLRELRADTDEIAEAVANLEAKRKGVGR